MSDQTIIQIGNPCADVEHSLITGITAGAEVGGRGDSAPTTSVRCHSPLTSTRRLSLP